MLKRAPTLIACPFNSPIYLSGLAHLGSVEFPPAAPAPILRRPVPGTFRCDGLGSWPYLWIDSADEISALSDAYSHLLTLTVVTQPGFRLAHESAAYFKDHYFYDPSRAFPALSKKARDHLRRAEQICAFDVVTSFDERMPIAGLYDELRRRRGLAGTFFDFPRIHFETVEQVVGAPIVFQVLLSQPGAKCDMPRWHIIGSEMLVVQEQELVLRGKNKPTAGRCAMCAKTVIHLLDGNGIENSQFAVNGTGSPDGMAGGEMLLWMRE